MPLLTPTDPLEDAAAAFPATVRVDGASSAKAFQGVWLDRADGDPLLVGYRAEGPIAALAGQRVTVVGAVYEPDGQAILATHFRVARLDVVDPAPGVEPIAVGPEQALQGRFVHEAGEPGSKRAEGWTSFVADDGTPFLLLGGPRGPLDTPVRITAHEVERSPFVAHMTGRHLWVTAVGIAGEPAATPRATAP